VSGEDKNMIIEDKMYQEKKKYDNIGQNVSGEDKIR